MEKIGVVFELQKDNPDVRLVDIHIMADSLAVYEEASNNVRRNGAIVAHPRTGAPMDNPYVKMAASAAAQITKLRRVKSDRVAALLREHYISLERSD